LAVVGAKGVLAASCFRRRQQQRHGQWLLLRRRRTSFCSAALSQVTRCIPLSRQNCSASAWFMGLVLRM
jgi:hypothetical protein